MAVDTKPDSELNPSQEDYDKKFNEIANAESSATFDNESKQTENASQISDQESSTPGRQGFYNSSVKSKAKGSLKGGKKKGPIALIISLVIGGGLGMGVMFSPSLLIVHLKETMVKALDDANPALSLRTNKMLWKKVNSIADGFEFSKDGKCNVRCKFGSVSESMKLNLEKPGSKFQVEFNETKVAGIKRYTIKTLTYDGKTVNTAQGFKKLMADPLAASDFKKHFNSKTAYFLNGKFGTVLREKFGINKLTKVYGETLDKAKTSVRKSLGLEGDKASTTPPSKMTDAEKQAVLEKHPVYSKAISKIRSINTKANAASFVCVAYNMGRSTTYAIKAAKMAAFASFAILFLNVADKIKSGDNVEPAAVEQIGNQLTLKDSNGLSATDSIGYKTAAFGDSLPASENDQKFSIMPVGAVVKFVTGLLAFLLATGVASLVAARAACIGANIVGMVAQCSEELIAAVVLIETVVGSLGALLACAGKLIAITVAASLILGGVLSAIITAIVQSELPVMDENTVGTDAGNAIYSGTASIMGGASASYGLKPGSQEEIKTYAMDTSDIINEQDAIARYEARSTPFDISNQYSFMGSIFSKLGLYSITRSSNLSIFNNILSFIPRALSSIQSPALAATTAAENKAKVYGNCDDWAIKNMGLGADSLCNLSYVMSSDELNADIDSTLTYMLGKYVDEDTGLAIPGSDYEKYVKYCADRVDPMGETAMELENEEYIWAVGSQCLDTGDKTHDEMLKNFRVYTMDYSINDTMEEYAY